MSKEIPAKKNKKSVGSGTDDKETSLKERKNGFKKTEHSRVIHDIKGSTCSNCGKESKQGLVSEITNKKVIYGIGSVVGVVAGAGAGAAVGAKAAAGTAVKVAAGFGAGVGAALLVGFAVIGVGFLFSYYWS